MYGDLEKDKPNYVSRMFSAIAPRYDLVNRLMTLGRDEAWRRLAARELRIPPDGLVLDVAAGTGDISRQVALLYPFSRVAALDFCVDMMLAGRHKFEGSVGHPEQNECSNGTRQVHPLQERVGFVCGDALALPYDDNTFDGVTTGFALRNVTDISHSLREMWRVLRPGGRMVCLEISRPPWRFISFLYWSYFFKVVPTLGSIISGQREAYTYLPQSARAFLSAEELAEKMKSAGFHHVRFHRLMLGTAAVHVGEKGI